MFWRRLRPAASGASLLVVGIVVFVALLASMGPALQGTRLTRVSRGDPPPQGGRAGSDEPQPPGESPLVPDAEDLRWLLLLIVGVLIAFLLWRLVRHRWETAAAPVAFRHGEQDGYGALGPETMGAAAGEALRRLDRYDDERGAVIAAWAAFEERLEAMRPRSPRDTAGVIATRALEARHVEAAAGPVVGELLELFQRARFAPTSPITVGDVQRARSLLSLLAHEGAADRHARS